jgi:hypothetical protein
MFGVNRDTGDAGYSNGWVEVKSPQRTKRTQVASSARRRTLGTMSAPAGPDRDTRPSEGPGIAAVFALYSLARLGLVALVAGLLLLAGTPLVIALLVALVVALPLSMLLFRGLRSRLDEALASARARRGVERAALRARLRGDGSGDLEETVGSGDRPQREAEGGQGRPDQQ